MLLKFKEKPYIKCGKKKIRLKVGDYILSNAACLQFIPRKPIDRDEYFRDAKTLDGYNYRVSKKELNRLISEYNFRIERYNKIPFGFNELISTNRIFVNYYFVSE